MAKWQSWEWSWPCMVPISFSSRPCCWNVYAVSPLLEIPIKNQARDIKKINVASTSSKGKGCFCHSGEKGLGSWHGKAAVAKGSWKADLLLLLPGSGWKRGEVSCFLSHSCCPEHSCLTPSNSHYHFCCPDICNGSKACVEGESCTDRESVCKTGWWWASPSASEENACGMLLGKSVTGTASSLGTLFHGTCCTSHCLLPELGLTRWHCSRTHLALHTRLLAAPLSLQALYVPGQTSQVLLFSEAGCLAVPLGETISFTLGWRSVPQDSTWGICICTKYFLKCLIMRICFRPLFSDDVSVHNCTWTLLNLTSNKKYPQST